MPHTNDVRASSTPGKYVIFCPRRRETLIRRMKHEGLPYKPLRGSYRGQRDRYLIVSLSTFRKIKRWAKSTPIIVLREPDGFGNRPATLYPTRKPVGSLRPFGVMEPQHTDSWTFDPSTHQYYVCD